MRATAAVLALLLGATAQAGDAKFVLKGDAGRGKGHYTTLCTQCHGERGRGDGPAATAAKLDPQPTNFTDPKNAERLTPEWVYQVVRDGGPSHQKSPLMVSWSGTLKDQEIRNVAAYVLKLKKAGALKQPTQAPKPPPAP